MYDICKGKWNSCRNSLILYIKALFDVIWQVIYVQSILQKLAIWSNNSNSFHRFETKGKEHNQITVIALNKIVEFPLDW